MIDILASTASSRFQLESAGVTGLRYPVRIADCACRNPVPVVAEWRLSVGLPCDKRGTHMSRFVEELHRLCVQPVDLERLVVFSRDLTARLESEGALVTAAFTWFREVEAPVTRQTSLLDYEVALSARNGRNPAKILRVQVPVKSLCPCSKAISARGAHNQRSTVVAEISFPESAAHVSINEVIRLVESAASSPVYPLLKREDEKFVTEAAYDNPNFVEDLVRRVAGNLCTVPGVASLRVHATNHESIHNHDVFAELQFDVERERARATLTGLNSGENDADCLVPQRVGV